MPLKCNTIHVQIMRMNKPFQRFRNMRDSEKYISYPKKYIKKK